ncbi:MAG: YceD family protein [Ectothiorhodospiraceae bacterium]|nr:DUF177 domain-containing protein [Paracoccaceae bacterium]MCH8503723.1 YceD family protein [Ectothiorhodospiraceae bacterium]
MTRQSLPVVVDVVRLADRQEELRGELPVGSLPRLCDSLTSGQGSAKVVLQFGRDEGRRLLIRGNISADVELQCQRCLRPMPWDLQATVLLAGCYSEQDADSLPETYDPIMIGDDPLRLALLVEDELILALPTLARHEDDPDCRPLELSAPAPQSEKPDDERQANPFAVLGALKRRDDS